MQTRAKQEQTSVYKNHFTYRRYLKQSLVYVATVRSNFAIIMKIFETGKMEAITKLYLPQQQSHSWGREWLCDLPVGFGV